MTRSSAQVRIFTTMFSDFIGYLSSYDVFFTKFTTSWRFRRFYQRGFEENARIADGRETVFNKSTRICCDNLLRYHIEKSLAVLVTDFWNFSCQFFATFAVSLFNQNTFPSNRYPANFESPNECVT
jgi:hypothetical protein